VIKTRILAIKKVARKIFAILEFDSFAIRRHNADVIKQIQLCFWISFSDIFSKNITSFIYKIFYKRTTFRIHADYNICPELLMIWEIKKLLN